jgi:2-oxoglutarate/2-oxoacid ferredoxin oxidoreductase subunit beta
MQEATQELSRKDFASDISVKWCPGCGDFNILMAVQSLMPKLGRKKEDFLFISGIGCSSRFPYYMNTYGFHTIHGRAPAIATGAKAANPNLDVWVITGDGDALSIGGNHFIHALRRNQDLKILLFNNQIYGLTKGQYSPTSAQGLKTGSTPFGSIDYPINPLSIALAANATFVARTADNDPKHMGEVFEAMAKHKGSAVVEILQNCVIFNDKVHDPYYARTTREETLIYVQEGQPLIFGKNHDKALTLRSMDVEITDQIEQAWVYQGSGNSPAAALALANLSFPDYPLPMGIFRQIHKPTFDELLTDQIRQQEKKQGKGTLEALLNSGTTWTVE